MITGIDQIELQPLPLPSWQQRLFFASRIDLRRVPAYPLETINDGEKRGSLIRTGYSRNATLSGWAIAIISFIQSALTTALPRTDKTMPLREDLRYWHVLIGLLLFAALIVRLRCWWREERGMAPVNGLRPGLFNWGRTLALAGYLLLLSMPVFGFLFAWGGATRVGIPGLFTFPALMSENYRLWLFSGYFHSAVGFMGLVLYTATLLTAAYGWLRYGKGLLTALPPGFGVQALLAMAGTSYALATFKSADPVPAAVARFLVIVAVVWGLDWFLAMNIIVY